MNSWTMTLPFLESVCRGVAVWMRACWHIGIARLFGVDMLMISMNIRGEPNVYNERYVVRSGLEDGFAAKRVH